MKIKGLILEDLLHLALTAGLVCFAFGLIGCASTPAHDELPLMPPAPVEEVRACEPISYDELADTPSMSAVELEERGRREMYDAFRDRILQQCVSSSCGVRIPEYSTILLFMTDLQAGTP